MRMELLRPTMTQESGVRSSRRRRNVRRDHGRIDDVIAHRAGIRVFATAAGGGIERSAGHLGNLPEGRRHADDMRSGAKIVGSCRRREWPTNNVCRRLVAIIAAFLARRGVGLRLMSGTPDVVAGIFKRNAN